MIATETFDRTATLEVIAGLVAELRPGRALLPPIEPGISLERELGLDSLTRMELLLRLERRFATVLPEELLATAETVRDLLDAIEHAAPEAEPRFEAVAPFVPGEPGELPERAETLGEVLEWHAERSPGRPHLFLLEDSGTACLTYGELAAGAARVAAGLARRRARGQAVALMLPTGLDYFHAFAGVLAAGAVPLPLYPPLRPAQLEEHLRRQAAILRCAQARLLVTVPEARALAGALQADVPGLDAVVTVDELRGEAGRAPPPARPGETALLQFTSGSTGMPKGVVLSHANLLANIRAMGRAAALAPGDVIVSWLPLYHDMGLIGAWLGSLYHALPLHLMGPQRFLVRPLRWLQAISDARGTVSTAPNFAYELCLNKIDDPELAGLDLSCWRLALDGAEPVSVRTLERFAARFAPCGLRKNALMPVYGLAECAVGLAFPPPGRGPLVDRVRADSLQLGRPEPAPPGDPSAIELASCGVPLPGHEVRIADEKGRELGERRVGRLLFRGPSATSGYLRNPEATRALVRGEWLDSGDLAYRAGGELFIAGRVKDLIIRGGRNIHPQQLEEAAGRLPGVRQGCVVAFGAPDPQAGTERLVVVAETRETDAARRRALAASIEQVVLDLLAQPADEVLLVAPRTLLKTSSGKLRRAECRALYLEGALLQRRSAPWRQRLRLGRRALVARLRRRAARVAGLGYAAHAWGLFALLVGPLWLAVVLIPRRHARLRLVGLVARLLARLAGTTIRVEGAGTLAVEPSLRGRPPAAQPAPAPQARRAGRRVSRRRAVGPAELARPQRARVPPPAAGDMEGALPEQGPFVVAVNHTSYADALALAAVLPPGPAFVAKRELERSWPLALGLDRLGTLFVERFDVRRGLADVDRAVRLLRGGRSLVFFPEGTFVDLPGLRPFHLGAFAAAARAGVPVVPLALRGTREILPGDSLLPRPGRVTVTIGPPLLADGADWPAVVRLRDAARACILSACGEPDAAG